MMDCRVMPEPLVRDDAAAGVGVDEWAAVCPNECGWQMLAQWQPTRKFYLLAIMAKDDVVFDDGTYHQQVCQIANAQVIARDELVSHLAG